MREEMTSWRPATSEQRASTFLFTSASSQLAGTAEWVRWHQGSPGQAGTLSMYPFLILAVTEYNVMSFLLPRASSMASEQLGQTIATDFLGPFGGFLGTVDKGIDGEVKIQGCEEPKPWPAMSKALRTPGLIHRTFGSFIPFLIQKLFWFKNSQPREISANMLLLHLATAPT